MKVVIYTDGGADPNPGIGGWAAILRADSHEKILTGNHPATTNNRMELQAAISALESLKRPSEVEFHTDSEYLRKGITEWIHQWIAKGWKSGNKTVLNVDLWQKLWPLVQQHQIEWHWVKGHAGNPLNERVDQLATEARLAITPQFAQAENIANLYVRASCKGNPGPGGWGVVLEQDGVTEEFSGKVEKSTNNRMELTAVIEGLLKLQPGTAVQIFTTSDYLFQGATQWVHGWQKNNWQKKDGVPVANADLWQALTQLKKGYTIRWQNAKGLELPQLSLASELASMA